MISGKDLQRVYNKLYQQLRVYIWPYRIIEEIADLEISVYRAFPSLAEVKSNFLRLKTDCLRLIYEDNEDLAEAFEKFEEKMNESSEVYAKLNTRVEGVE